MSPSFIIRSLVVVTWIIMLVSGLVLFRKGRQITLLYRRLKNPPYPIRAEEIQKVVEGYNSNPLKTIPLVFNSFFRQQRILWARYPKPEDNELRVITTQTRKLLLLSLVAFVVMIAITITVFIWAGVNHKLN